MNPSTLSQAKHLLELASQQDLSEEKLQAVIGTGVFSDLFKTPDPAMIDRNAVRRALRLEPAPWKEIVLGRYRSGAALYKAIEGCSWLVVNVAVRQMLRSQSFEVASDETRIELFKLSLAALGLGRTATSSEISAEAARLDLGPCPAEVGPLLRWGYAGQDPSEHLVIWMRPLRNGVGAPCMFTLRNYPDRARMTGGSKFLEVEQVDEETSEMMSVPTDAIRYVYFPEDETEPEGRFWDQEQQFVFCRR